MITRTFRAAIRLGEDFITLEETIELPADATDEQIAQAADLGWRIYRSQRNAAEAQIADLRASIPIVEAPASDKQRNYIGMLQEQLRWTTDNVLHAAQGLGFDLTGMTKDQASTLIESMKALTESTPAPRQLPKTAAEAQQRFFAKYGQQIGGTNWVAAQKYLSSRAPSPTTIDGWIAAAEAVRDRATQPARTTARTLPDDWAEAPV